MRHLLLILILLAAAAAFAQSPTPDPQLGSRPGAFSARSLGMGHIFLTGDGGASALMGNPAMLAAQETEWRVDISGDVSRVKETRSYPFYDAFDGILGYNNYAMNDHLYSRLDGGISWRVPNHTLESLVLSAGSYSAYRFDYRYHEEVRNRFSAGGVQDLRLGENKLDITGDLRSISLGAAARSKGKISAGFGLNLLMGDWSYLDGVYYADPEKSNMVTRIDYSANGTPAEAAVGAAYELNPRITLAGRALLPTGDFKFDQSGSVLSEDTTISGHGTVTMTYPSHYALGVRYRPQHEFHPTLSLEGEIHTYRDVDEALDNTFELRAGAEQSVVPGTPVRLGFVYYTSPQDKDRSTTLFTAGIGFSIKRMTADLGVEVGKLNYVSRDLFPQSLYGETDRLDSDFDHVETALFRGMIGLHWAL